MCFLEVVDPFGFLGHVVAGGNSVRWSASSDKLRSNAGVTSLPSTSPWLGPPLLPICLSPYPTPITHTTCMFFLPTVHVCGVDSRICT